MAIKKAIFKTSAFFKGFLLPLAEDATAREAVIVGSILAKMSIQNLDSAAALMKLLQMPYQVGTGFFIKTLLAKRYALPTQVLKALVEFFSKYEDDQNELFETMPVMWH
jgi:essential nuclear protein 1